MKKLLTTSIILFFCFSAIAQKKNAISLELGGHCAFYSINYERLILDFKSQKTIAQIGGAYYPQQTGIIQLWIPISINQLMAFAPNHYAEIGAGIIGRKEGSLFLKALNRDKIRFNTWIFRAGYRYQPADQNWYLKASYTPLLETQASSSEFKNLFSEFTHTGAVAWGWRF